MVFEKSRHFVIRHGILPVFSPNFTNCIHSFADMKKVSISLKRPHFLLLQNVANRKFGSRDSLGKSTKRYRKVMENNFAKSVGTLSSFELESNLEQFNTAFLELESTKSGFPLRVRLENLENEMVIEHEKLVKSHGSLRFNTSHGIVLLAMEF